MGHSHSKEGHHSTDGGGQRSGGKWKPKDFSSEGPPKFKPIKDCFESIEDVQEALQHAGLESSNLIIGIDYTISNTGAGARTFGGYSLHALDSPTPNPYRQVIQIIGKTLARFDDDNQIPVFGFGDKKTSDKSVFPFMEDRTCNGFEEVLEVYEEITPTIQMAGPTSFAPLIREAIRIVQEERSYHILVIIADGQVTHDSEYCNATAETTRAIVEASQHPLSILVVGVGDGPWEQMEEFDDGLPQRKFDNFQFVDFHKEMQKQGNKEANFAVASLQEIPQQFYYIRKLGYL
eukprot:TRINITY_DN3720_c0_g1_i1.p1 TRINITY_DN3720_c0_g1~~TRINITY_DN3720_c0_g1_i1.p1  ORF type:complete len:291 (+),score=59.28 TRINITY_DN3720_c0_g1_i1:473-1345(+)